ncbi:4'-phosphopantetheinyl transferase family protein [Blattabacterium cuenoti]|uniref:4'-phosphopantetheinyl transferase family protein n=1 Tax=Blattabacterium cuenoti TaxID=1653831 RepID=UPI00163D1291|nr:4'-phosphopantetheinyl transferase superfamily protein [Blattabacterium cuenoti]
MKNIENNNIHTKIIVLKWIKFLDSTFISKIKLNDKEKIFYNSLSEKRKKEFLGIRLGIRCILKYIGIKISVIYNEKKKFFFLFHNKKYISLSHSYDRMAIAISSFNVGIDIEKFRLDNKIMNIKNKFIRKDENSFIRKKYEKDYLHIIWGIKESLYKLSKGIFYNFLKNYKVSPFCIDANSYISCWILKKNYSKKFYAFYRKIKNYYLVYSIDLDI